MGEIAEMLIDAQIRFPGIDPTDAWCKYIDYLTSDTFEGRRRIRVLPSSNADTRTCDPSKVTKQELLDASISV
jgi:hypothetical protein